MLSNNVAPGHASVIYQLEVQAEYILKMLVGMREGGVEVVEVKEKATRDYNA